MLLCRVACHSQGAGRADAHSDGYPHRLAFSDPHHRAGHGDAHSHPHPQPHSDPDLLRPPQPDVYLHAASNSDRHAHPSAADAYVHCHSRAPARYGDADRDGHAGLGKDAIHAPAEVLPLCRL